MQHAYNDEPREPWERPDGSLDAVQLQRTLRERVSKKLETMTVDEQLKWIKEEARRFMSTPHHEKG